MTTPIRKKLIEVSIPLEAINVASAREKSIRHGHPSTLHLWWARRPLAACRAVLFAQLVDDPSSWPDRFPTEEAQDAERRRLHKVIEAMVPWEASNNETILNAARWEIARSVAWGLGEEPPAQGDGPAILDYLQTKAPPVYDPFSGGGSIPLEAQRLGLRAYGSDLNPVAVLIGKALVEIPPKFAGRSPVNPKSRAEATNGQLRAWKGAQGLAEDVRYYGQWMRDEAEKRIGHLYPKAALADGSKATVIAWFWVRTIKSPDPSAKGAMVPLASTFMLSTKGPVKAWVTPIIDPDAEDGYRFEVETGALSAADEGVVKLGTKTGRGEFACLLSGAALKDDYIRDRTLAGDGSWRAMAIVAEAKKGKQYVSVEAAPPPPVPDDLLSETPEQLLFKGALGFRLPAYGVLAWGDFFRARQIAALSVFSNLIEEVKVRVEADAEHLGVLSEEYSRGVATYLICALGRAVDYWTINTMWEPGGEFIIHTFSEMTIPIVWDSAEGNPFAPGGGGWNKTCLDWVVRVIEALPSPVGSGSIINLQAQDIGPPSQSSFSSDPPYFDNIGYADLSDAFYVWERKPLSLVFPELGRRLATPKDNELVATAARHGGAVPARDFFLKGMKSVFEKMHRAGSTDPISIYYSFKEKGRVGEGSGWESFLEAIVGPGWQIDASWPLKTERPTRNRSIGKAALASAVVLVCRRRPANAEVCTRSDFVRMLKHELPFAVASIRKAGVSPVDLQQCIIGPGIGVYSRFSRVLEDDDTTMSVKTALTLVNRIWSEIENEVDTNFDAETQVALAWYASFGFEAASSGELITQANAKSLPMSALIASGVFKDLKGKVALASRADLPSEWSPAADRTLTVWECVQHTARVLNAEEGGGEAAAKLVAQMGSKAEEARALAYRLFQIATHKGWSAEERVYNELAQEWTKLEDRAATLDDTGRAPGPNQTTFAFDGSA
jgi:putative DNA methylase